MKTFRNPVSPFDAPDPFMTYVPETGYYYALFTRGRVLELFRSRRASEICTGGDSKVIYTADGPKDGIWGDIWAPEMHKSPDGTWYIYTSGRIREERGASKRIFIMEALSDDPFGDWRFKCIPTPDTASIDPTIYTAANGKQFLCCAREDRGLVLTIYEMENPYTFGSLHATISRAKYGWETMPPYTGDGAINEGPFFVEERGRLYIIYSGNGCWSDYYGLGVLEYMGGDRGDPAKMCDPGNWLKHEEPILVMANGVYGPGHASFFHSPDGKELWCAYHGMKAHNETVTYAPRFFNIQKVDFDESGYPVMGSPVGYETDSVPPSGEPEEQKTTDQQTIDPARRKNMIKFSEMPYRRPDMDALSSAIEEATRKVTGAASYSDVREAYFALQAMELESVTMFTICSVRNTIDTTDTYYESEMKWLREARARMIPQYKRWKEALVSSAFRKDFEAEFGAQLFRELGATLMTSDEKIIPETIRQGELTQAYQKETATATTNFRGSECNFYGLLKHMQSIDRQERKEAFEAWAGLYERISGNLDAQYGELVRIRNVMAKKMGFKTYTEMAYILRNRFDYTQEDAARFREQVLKVITPVVAKIREIQKEKLGVDKLRYYDEGIIFPDGNAKPIGTPEELVLKARAMYREMSPETGEFFDFMTEYELFDLVTRPGKRMGGYMTRFPAYKAPFIFSNFNGTEADVDVLTHEAGHAFQGYLSMRSIPVAALCGSTSEINEIHSMSMEHFAYPWMESFFGENTEKYLTAHLLGSLSVLPYMVCVDEFQHRVYNQPEMSPMEWRAAWREIEKKYMPWRDYDGNDFLEGGGFWMQKQHVFLYPFYYIEYALAQICAFQYYSRMKENRAEAWQDYLRLCRAGGTKGYYELLKIGNLMNPFKEGTVEKSTAGVIEEILRRYGK